MQVIDRIDAFRKALDAARAAGRTVGLVPTMGYLHDGHASLIRRAAAECDVVAVTIFVNPLQFGAGEDLSAYPRDLDGDVALAAAGGASIVFAPPVEEMYPDAVQTSVRGRRHRVTGSRAPAARPLRRRRHGRRQAVRHRRAVPGLLRREGLPAARRRAPHGRRPLVPGRRRGLPDRARARRPGPVEPQRLPHGRTSGPPPGAAPGRWPAPPPPSGGRAGSRSRPPPDGRRRRPPSPSSPSTTPRSSASTISVRPTPVRRAAPAGRRARRAGPTHRQRGSAPLMRRRMMKSKIHRATVTDANLNYVGSITLDPSPDGAGRHPRVGAGRRPRHRQRRPLRDLRHPRRARARCASTAPPPASCTRATRSSSSPTPTTRTPSSRASSRWSCTSTSRRPMIALDASSAEGAVTRSSVTLDLDLLVLGSGVAGLSAAVRAAAEPGMRVGVLTKAELAQSATRWAQGGVAGRRQRRGLHRPAPGRHAGGRRRPVRRRRRAGARRRGPGARQRAHRPGRGVRPRPRRRAELAARAATPCPASCTPAARPPAPRSSGRWSTPCGRRRPPCSRHWFALDLIVEGGRCRGVVALDPPAAPTRCGPPTPCWPPAAPASCSRSPPTRAVDRRRRGHGAAGRRAGRRRRVHAVPPDRPAPPGHAAALAVRGPAGPRRRCCATPTASASSTSWRRATS